MRLWGVVITLMSFMATTLVARNASATVYPDQFFVKFTSPAKSTKTLQEMRDQLKQKLKQYGIVGEVRALVRRPLLHQFQQRLVQRQGLQKRAVGIVQRLQSIYRLRISQPYAPAYVQKLVASLPFVEYVEPVPKRWISGASNDPLLADQKYLEQIHVLEAWDYLPENADTVVVAVLDTGADLDHEDLQEHIFLNSGEMGTDANGRDKRNNGIDDDGNGYVDDWQGWDFFYDDNEPVPGNSHGTHVAGIIGAVVNNGTGIAGVNPYVKLLILKLGPDDPFSVTVAYGYEAMVYAAAMGARIINCSWGGPTRSRAEQEVIDAVTQSGTLVVAAAGNEGIRQTFYPAGYQNVIAVGSVNAGNRRSYFSNYGYFIDVMAPGENILSTVPNNQYRRQSGTSMASPVAAGVASLIAVQHPEYSPLQIGEHLKITCDSIDHLQPNFTGLLGYGRVNALRAVSTPSTRAMIVQGYQFADADGDQVMEKGEEIRLNLDALNVLAPVQNARVELQSDTRYPADPPTVSLSIGALETLQPWSTPSPLVLQLPEAVPSNYLYSFRVVFYDGDVLIGRTFLSIIVNPTYRTVAENDIAVTLNDRGNLGYNDYPNNVQGDGFRYQGGPSVLFEGALMVGISPDRLSNVARGADQMRQDRSFVPLQPVQVIQNVEQQEVQAVTQFQDQQRIDEVGVRVVHRLIEPLVPELSNVVLLEYTVTNETAENLDSLFTGLYFDWDIGMSGQGDLCLWDDEGYFGYVYNTRTDSLPHIGLALLSKQPINFFAIDNDGSGGANPGVYDGFTRSEKWQTMTSGIGRERSNVTDVSAVIAGGPVSLAPGESEKFIFGIAAGWSRQEVRVAIDRMREYLQNKGVDVQMPVKKSPQKLLVRLYPNPATADQLPVLELQALDSQQVEVELVSVLGRLLGKLPVMTMAPQQVKRIELQQLLTLPGVSNAQYFIRVRTPEQVFIVPVVLLQ